MLHRCRLLLPLLQLKHTAESDMVLTVTKAALSRQLCMVYCCAPPGDVASNDLHQHEDEAQDACYHQLALDLRARQVVSSLSSSQ
jgi:hypothetical protein